MRNVSFRKTALCVSFFPHSGVTCDLLMGEEAVIQETALANHPWPAEHSGTFFLYFPLEIIWKRKHWDLYKAGAEDLMPEGITELN